MYVYYVYVCVFMYVYMCSMCKQCLIMAEEGIRSTGTELHVGVSYHMSAGIETVSSERPVGGAQFCL